MSFRARLALVSAAAVALAVILASIVGYVVVRDELRSTVDDALRERAEQMSHQPLDRVFRGPGPEFGGPSGYPQLVSADGETLRPRDQPTPLPVNARVIDVAAGNQDAYFNDAEVAGTHVRIITFPYLYLPGKNALQLARDMTEVDKTLSRLRSLLFLIGLAGIALAAALGLAVSRAALAPVRRLTAATENVTETGDLSERIEARGQDELSRLAVSFNTMLGALEESTRKQRQLVADASHELRTPLTSLRTNIEVLASGRRLPAAERKRLLSDVVEQLTEMTNLIAELIALARDGELREEPEDVRLDLLAGDAVERARRNRPEVTFKTDLEESFVNGVPESIERAVVNLLDNAAKWSTPGGEVDVTVRDGTVSVRDHGPGIDEADLPYVFDRFYRAASARGMPGSGLGLAIVRQVADAHGGEVVAERAEGGGTRITLRLNGSEPS